MSQPSPSLMPSAGPVINMERRAGSGNDANVAQKQNWRRYVDYYRDKYLILAFFLAALFAVMELWSWPVPPERLRSGVMYLAAAAVCMLLAKRKLLLVGGALAIVTLRGATFFLISRNWIALVMALVSGTLLYALLRRTWKRYEDLKMPERYGVKEMIADVFVFFFLFFLMIGLRYMIRA